MTLNLDYDNSDSQCVLKIFKILENALNLVQIPPVCHNSFAEYLIL
jgi:hypothetical protein